MYLQKKLTLISLARTWGCGETQSLLRSFFTYSARACSTASTGLSLAAAQTADRGMQWRPGRPEASRFLHLVTPAPQHMALPRADPSSHEATCPGGIRNHRRTAVQFLETQGNPIYANTDVYHGRIWNMKKRERHFLPGAGSSQHRLPDSRGLLSG